MSTTSAAPHEAFTRLGEWRQTRLAIILMGLVSSVPASVLLAVGFKALVSRISPVGELDSFRVGALALTGQSKAGEMTFPFVLFGAMIAWTFLWARVSRRRLPDGALRLLTLEAVLATLVVVPLVFANAGPLFGIMGSPLVLIAMMQFAVALFYAVQWLSDKSLVGTVHNTQGLDWLSAASVLSALGVVMALRYVTSPADFETAVILGLTVLLIVVIAAVLGRVSAIGAGPPLWCAGWGFAVAGIAALPLLLPPLMVQPGSRSILVAGTDAGGWKLFLLVAAVVILVETALRVRYRAPLGAARGISSFAVAALIVPLRGNYSLPTISSDDYHFGEVFTPSILWQLFDQVPYVDIILARGFVANVSHGVVNAVLSNGTAATLQYAGIVVALIVVALSHLLLRHVVGFALATAMVGLIGVANYYLEGDLLTVSLAVVVLWMVVTRSHPLVVGVSVTVAVAVAVLAYPLMGVAVAGVTAGVVAAATLGACLRKPPREWRYVMWALLGVTISLAAILSTPISAVLQAALEYVASNASANAEANGTALDAVWSSPLVVGQLLSFSFALGVFVSAWLLWNMKGGLRKPNWSTYAEFAVAAVPGVLSVLLLGRYMGRIDVGDWLFRAAAGSLVMLGLVVPAVLVIVGARRYHKAAWGFVAAGALLALIINPVGRGGLVTNVLGLLPAPQAWASQPFVSSVPRLGLGQGDPAHLQSIADLRVISQRIPAGESVLNLSNRNALNGYLEWPSAIGYLAPYNIESTEAELNVISQLEETKPGFAFIGPGPWFDGLTLSLRDPILAGWIMDQYSPIQCGATTWATLKSRPNLAQLLTCPSLQGGVLSDDATLWANSIGAPEDIGIIPFSWGSRTSEFNVPSSRAAARPSDDDVSTQTLVLTFSDEALSLVGGKADLLRLQVMCATNPAASEPGPGNVATLSWGAPTPEATNQSSSFQWGPGDFIVPLDAYPTWYLGEEAANSLEITVPNGDCLDGWQVDAQLASRSSGQSH